MPHMHTVKKKKKRVRPILKAKGGKTNKKYYKHQLLREMEAKLSITTQDNKSSLFFFLLKGNSLTLEWKGLVMVNEYCLQLSKFQDE